MTSIQIKSFEELTTIELYDMLQLRVAVFCVEQNCPYQDLDDKDKLAHHILFLKEDKIIGTCRLLPKGVSYTDYCSIGRVAVALSERMHRYGIALMEKAIEECLTLYNCAIKISAQHYLKDFYTRLGFNAIGDVYLEDNIPHIAMIFNFKPI